MPKMRIIWLLALLIIGIGVIGSLITYPTSAKQVIQEEFEFDVSNIEQIDILSDNAQVELLTTDDPDTKVKVTAEGKYDQLLTDLNGDTLSIEMKDKKFGFNINFFGNRTSLTIYAPEKVYHILNVKNHNGKVILNEIAAEEVNVDIDNGKMKLQHVNADMIDVETNNGNMEIEHVTATKIHAETDNGHMMFNHVEGILTGKTNNGNVTIKTAHLDRPIDFKTNNGRITIETDEKPTNVVFDLKTSNGKITVFDDSDWDTIIGSGDHLVKLRTSNGKIIISD